MEIERCFGFPPLGHFYLLISSARTDKEPKAISFFLCSFLNSLPSQFGIDIFLQDFLSRKLDILLYSLTEHIAAAQRIPKFIPLLNLITPI